MPWKEIDRVSLRREFVGLAGSEGANIRALCRSFGISPKTGYKWLERFTYQGDQGLQERSRRPVRSPRRTSEAVETEVLRLRDRHPAWGGRKIAARLRALGSTPPSPSTVTEILRRHGRLDPSEASKHKPWERFERPTPNDLWQVDFKGHFATGDGRCHPLTALDDHSRFALGLDACADERSETTRAKMIGLFRRYGLPSEILCDNGPPWGTAGTPGYSAFEVWLLRLGVNITHGRPCHPQTQGKDERFHRTLVAEVLRYQCFRDLQSCQASFEDFRQSYNWERPHEALGMDVPGSRYKPSDRAYPEVLPPIEYSPGQLVRKVNEAGQIRFRTNVCRVGKGFSGYPVALRPTLEDGLWEVVFCGQHIRTIDLKAKEALDG